MRHKGDNLEKEAIWMTAQMMAASAKTAPKGMGMDNVEVVVLDGNEKSQLVMKMKEIGNHNGMDFFIRDAACVEVSPYIVLIGVKNRPIKLANCGFCGFENCSKMAEAGANCVFNITDLGIAIGSAVSIAANNRVDNRVMFSAGKAAISLGFLSKRVSVCYGVPLSTTSKNVYYDRD